MENLKVLLLIASILSNLLFASGQLTNILVSPPQQSAENSEEADIKLEPCTSDGWKQDLVKNGTINEELRWLVFAIQMDPSFTLGEATEVRNAIHEIENANASCIKFYYWPPEYEPIGDYVYITRNNGEGCHSQMGRRGGRQVMNLESPECISRGTILHQMMHALGFDHEHMRADRDDHVQVLWGNIEDGRAKHFLKNYTPEETPWVAPYDINSVMHYGPLDFSRNENPTILARNGQPVGSTGQLSLGDREKLTRMYECNAPDSKLSPIEPRKHV